MDERQEALQELIAKYGNCPNEDGSPDITITTDELIDLWLENRNFRATLESIPRLRALWGEPETLEGEWVHEFDFSINDKPSTP